MQFGTVQTVCASCGKLVPTSIQYCQLCGHATQPQAVYQSDKPLTHTDALIQALDEAMPAIRKLLAA